MRLKGGTYLGRKGTPPSLLLPRLLVDALQDDEELPLEVEKLIEARKK